MFKNVAGQSVTLSAFNATTGLPVTGDAANQFYYVNKDDAGPVAITAASGVPTEVDAAKSKGRYKAALAQTETAADKLDFTGTSSTAGVVIVPLTIYTVPAGFTAFSLANLDVAVSTRSVYAGGEVASVTAPVTVGTNSDKTGYSLSVTPPTASAIASATDTQLTGTHGGGAWGGGSAPTVGQIVTGVFEELLNGGNFGTAGSYGALIVSTLNATVGSRSTYAGGPVASVTAPVTATVSDKTGFKLASDGVDGIQVEAGIDMRQAMSLRSAALGGVVAGANTTHITIAAAGSPSTPRIAADVDQFGNRSNIVLTLPT